MSAQVPRAGFRMISSATFVLESRKEPRHHLGEEQVNVQLHILEGPVAVEHWAGCLSSNLGRYLRQCQLRSQKQDGTFDNNIYRY
jgi:hypothetical protein